MQNSILTIILLQVPSFFFTHSCQSVSLADISPFVFPGTFVWLRALSLARSLLTLHSLLVFISTLVTLGMNFKWCFLDTSTLMCHRLLTPKTNMEPIILPQNLLPRVWTILVTGAISSGFIPLSCWCSKPTQKPSSMPSSP